MNETKHTPGPWATYVNDLQNVVIRKMFADGQESHQVAKCTSGFANARLIAAAPELLAALRGMVALDEENHQRGSDDMDVCAEVQAAYAAIAKATGSEV